MVVTFHLVNRGWSDTVFYRSEIPVQTKRHMMGIIDFMRNKNAKPLGGMHKVITQLLCEHEINFDVSELT